MQRQREREKQEEEEEEEEEAQVRRWYLLHNRIIFAPRSAG